MSHSLRLSRQQEKQIKASSLGARRGRWPREARSEGAKTSRRREGGSAYAPRAMRSSRAWRISVSERAPGQRSTSTSVPVISTVTGW